MGYAVTVDNHQHQPEQKTDSSSLELADIFNQYADDYIAKHKISLKQHKVIFNIRNCQKGAFGYHIDICDNCGSTEKGYNSCHDRHCPKCQGNKRRQWVQSRVKELLPVPYYHTVFTLPHYLFPLSLYNKSIIYNLLFTCAAQTLHTFGHDPKHLGGRIGFYGILHTWGGKLWQHLHIHFIVPGGGLNDAGQWIEPKFKGKFLFPVCALSEMFRGKFVEGLKRSYYNNELKLPDELAQLADPGNFEQWVTNLVGRNWVVYSKAPLTTPEKAIATLSGYANKNVLADNKLTSSSSMLNGNECENKLESYPEKVVGYIGRYTNQTAIGNDQLGSMDHGQVTFSFKNYKNRGKLEETTLPVEEFIRRFLMHVLPNGFHRIRYFGLFANGQRQKNIEDIRQQLSVYADEAILALPEIKKICSVCGKGTMVSLLVVFPFGFYISKIGISLQRVLPFDTS